ncbi:MAG: toluene tolerance protein [Azoarcus sp.]|nr:toluene tolerance protein [Azoarcus sp.]
MMHTLNHEEFLALRAGAEVIESDHHGEKVLRLTDGRFLKLFRRKRLISSAALYPYAQRFVDNARALALREIPIPDVLEGRRIPSIKRDAVLYWPLEGNSLRELAQRGLDPETEKRLKRLFTDFVIQLHSVGIFFRSLHLGNVILTPGGKLGLIDFSNMCIYSRPLPTFMCHRNIRQMQKEPSERDWVDSEAIIESSLNNPAAPNSPGSLAYQSFLLELVLQRLQEAGIFRGRYLPRA